MTAFARFAYKGSAGRFTWELRSVNHRYMEVFFRLPDDFRSMESELRAKLVEHVHRGKVDCNLRVEKNTDTSSIVINESYARSVIDAAKKINKLAESNHVLNSMDVLQWPGVLEVEKKEISTMSKEIICGFDKALEQLIETREREGGKLYDFISQRCDGVETQITELRTRIPEIIALTRNRYLQRLQEHLQELDNGRIEQECALLIQKLDVAEELDRLEAHLDEVRRVVEKGSPAGRRLDFLMQELNREANTIGSKASHIDSSSASVELKVLIEQMREQIQNIE